MEPAGSDHDEHRAVKGILATLWLFLFGLGFIIFFVWLFFPKLSQIDIFPLFFRSLGSGSADRRVAAKVASEESDLCSTSVSSHILSNHFTCLLFHLSHSFKKFITPSLLSIGLNSCHLEFHVGLCVLEEMHTEKEKVRFQV